MHNKSEVTPVATCSSFAGFCEAQVHEATDNSGDVTEFCSKRKSEETERESPKKPQKTRKIIFSREKAPIKFGTEGQISNAV